jgi:predicted transcriptional regulator of viral defense system
MKLNGFLANRGIFTSKELDHYLASQGSVNKSTRHNILAYYQANGRIIQVRRGLYCVTPQGGSSGKNPCDPYLIASKIKEDAVLGYHTALELHGKAHSAFFHFYYLTQSRLTPFEFRGSTFKAVAVPHALRKKGKELFGVISYSRFGGEIRVTGFERTLVDVLDRPELAGGWEEVWRSLESIEFFDLDQVLEYVELLEKDVVAGKVGFFLEQHKESLMVDEKYLDKLQKLSPKQPYYLNDRHQSSGHLLKKWNLIVPEEVSGKTWEEVL